MIYPKLSDGTIDWCVMCKNEGDDFYDLCCECEYPENSDENSDDPPTKYEPKPMTNADKLRSMSDEALAEKIGESIDCEVCKTIHHSESGECPCRPHQSCVDFWLDWLRQEATE